VAWSLSHKTTPAKLDQDAGQLRQLQLELVHKGHPVFWYDDVPVHAPQFSAMQMGGAQGWWKVDAATLHAEESNTVSEEEAAHALDRSDLTGSPDLSWKMLQSKGYEVQGRSGPVRRLEFAEWMIQRMQGRRAPNTR
jgi:hypothetical protein